jgi:coniferyl-aldehyde dehydrogenase
MSTETTTKPAGGTASADIRGEMESTLCAQRQAFLEEGFPTLETRIDRLNRLIGVVSKNADRIVEAVNADYGVRPAVMTMAFDVVGVINSHEFCKAHLAEWMEDSPVAVEPGNAALKARVIHQPMGVVGIMGPWNVPVSLTLGDPLAYALAAGNRVMIKPSSKTPRTAELIKEMIAGAFDPTEIAVFTGTGAVNDAFDALPFDKVIFTGSPRIGSHVLEALAPHMTPALMELGGKNPTIVGPEADIADAAEQIWGMKMLNSGQVCVSADHVFVPRGKEDEFVAKCREVLTGWYPSVAGNPNYTAIINDHNYHRLLGYIADAKAAGLRVEQLTPDEPLSTEFRQIPPTIIVNPPADMAIMREEVFGPILPLISYDSLDDVVAAVNAEPSPLGLYYFGTDKATMDRLAYDTASGGVAFNDVAAQVLDGNIPFGGVGNSGQGKYHGSEGFSIMCSNKAVAEQALDNPMRKAYMPPAISSPDMLAYMKSTLPQS